jgi:hypothetical protein
MAESKNNVVTHGLSGLIGDLLVFRQRANKTYVGNKPRPSSKGPTAMQMEIRERFKRATRYAKSALKDLVLRAAYALSAKSGQSAHNVAFVDYQKSPEFYEDMDLTPYTGAVGDKILVSVIDDFKVKTVHVEIKAPGGAVLEEGFAVQEENELDWVYTTTAANSELPGTQIIFTAKDYPGNETVLEKILV